MRSTNDRSPLRQETSWDRNGFHASVEWEERDSRLGLLTVVCPKKVPNGRWGFLFRCEKYNHILRRMNSIHTPSSYNLWNSYFEAIKKKPGPRKWYQQMWEWLLSTGFRNSLVKTCRQTSRVEGSTFRSTSGCGLRLEVRSEAFFQVSENSPGPNLTSDTPVFLKGWSEYLLTTLLASSLGCRRHVLVLRIAFLSGPIKLVNRSFISKNIQQ